MADENNNQYYTPGQDNQQPNPPQPQVYNQFNGNMPPQEEKANVGLAILSFIIPIVGLILFLTKKSEKPKTAKACGISALVSVILGIVCSIIMSIASTALLGGALSDIDTYGDSSYVDQYGDYDLDEFLNSDVTE